MSTKILVIKHGAFGDFIMAEGAFRAIKAHHPNAKITLLTSSPFKELAQDSSYFDEVKIDDRKPFWHLSALKNLRKIFKTPYDCIYDLQTSSRTKLYYWFLKHRKSQWCGAVGQYALPLSEHSKYHVYERHRKQLELAGLKNIPDPSSKWLLKHSACLDRIGSKFVIMVTGASKEEKCWPIDSYRIIAESLIEKGYQIVLTGTSNEAEKIDYILSNISTADAVISLKDQADFYEYVSLSQKASLIIGNDTGPFHLMAMSENPSIVLLSKRTNPYISVSPWQSVSYIKKKVIADISIKDVQKLITQKLT